MSDKNHTGETSVLFWVEVEFLKDFDKALKQAKYKSRAEFFREQMRNLIRNYPPQK